MKKLLCTAVCLSLIFALTSCNIDINIHTDSDENDTATTSDTAMPDNKDTEAPTDTTASDEADTEQSTTAENRDTDNDTESNDDTSAPPEHIDNGVLKDVSPQTMRVPENMKFLGTDNATEENNAANMSATVVLYSLDGDVVNWKTENDLVYVITKGNNRLVVIDSENMTPIYNVPLAGIPAEMNFVDDKIYVSLPDLCRIDIFAKSDCTKVSSLYFDHEVASFCLDGDYIFYTEMDQHCRVFKKNLVTGSLKTVETDNRYSFYFPKVYLNQEDRILYIGESGSTGSALYYFNADTLALKSVFRKNDYGIMNHTREIFHYGNEIFWGSYRLSDTNAKELVGKYGAVDYGSVTFVSDELVSTYEGLFLTDTYECVINYFDAGFDFQYMLVSDSYNVFFRKRVGDQNIIIGINFELQEVLGTII